MTFSCTCVGQKAGFLGSAYFIGNLVGSPFWGWMSDVWGRRPVMLMGVVGSMFSQLLFGFRQASGWAWLIILCCTWLLRYISEMCC